MKTKIIALSATVLFATASAAFPQGAKSKTGHEIHHKLSKKRHPSVSGYVSYDEMQVGSGYRGVFGYETEQSRQAGGGGGGGGGM